MNFITKQSNRLAYGYERSVDILVSVNRNGDRHKYGSLVISFSEKVHRIIFNESDYGVIAFSDDGSRIYFKSEARGKGYKLTSTKNSKTRIMKMSINTNLLRSASKNWIGYYNAEFDPDYALWFIAIEKKIKSEE